MENEENLAPHPLSPLPPKSVYVRSNVKHDFNIVNSVIADLFER